MAFTLVPTQSIDVSVNARDNTFVNPTKRNNEKLREYSLLNMLFFYAPLLTRLTLFILAWIKMFFIKFYFEFTIESKINSYLKITDIMLSQMKTNSTRKLEGKRPKELMSSSSLSGMSQLSNSSEETLEPLVHKPHKLETTER